MFTPKLNRNENTAELHEFIRKHSFAILISTVEGKPWATHIPLMLSQDGTKLNGHLARGNKQWKEWNAESEMLAIFSGPHSYISSSWYDHENVPTWNYIAVHVYGKLKIIDGDELVNSLRNLTDQHEAHSKNPVSVDTMSKEFLKKELLGIVGFEIVIEKMEATYKLSQNRDATNHKAIITELEKSKDHAALAIADEMKKAGHS